MISEEDRETLAAYLAIGDLWRRRGEALIEAVNRCYELKSAKGIEDMVAFSWNTQGINPKFGGGGGLPVGKHPVIIYNTKLEPTQSGSGGKMVLQLEIIDGPMKGAKGDENLTLQHSNPTVVRISSEQLTAICHVVGIPQGFQDTSELHNKPFVVEVAPQKDKPEYTEVVGVFDMNGNEPGQQTGQANNANNGGNFGGNNGGNFGGGQQNNQGGGNPGGGWGNGGNAGGNAGGQQGGQGQPDPNAGQQGQQNGGGAGWGGSGGGAANQGGGNGGGWQQNGGGNNGQQGGGWGNRQ